MKDFLLNDNNDVDFGSNDLKIGVSDYQHQQHILIAQKGSLKEFPTRGVGIENYLNDGEIDEMVREIRSEFEQDGMSVNEISFDEQTGELNYDANYNS